MYRRYVLQVYHRNYGNLWSIQFSHKNMIYRIVITEIKLSILILFSEIYIKLFKLTTFISDMILNCCIHIKLLFYINFNIQVIYSTIKIVEDKILIVIIKRTMYFILFNFFGYWLKNYTILFKNILTNTSFQIPISFFIFQLKKIDCTNAKKVLLRWLFVVPRLLKHNLKMHFTFLIIPSFSSR